VGRKDTGILSQTQTMESTRVTFSGRKVFRREYHGVIAVIAIMFVLEIVSDINSGHGFAIDTIWRIVLPVVFGAYFVVRFVHKHTSFLQSQRSQTSNLAS
jgi:uncharacterized membrane protein YhaH (DUF805 family)